MKTKMSIIIIVTSLMMILPCGCAHKTVWYHPTKRTQDFYRDKAKCWTMANSQYMANAGYQPGTGLAGSIGGLATTIAMNRARNELFDFCMMGEGWYLDKK